MISSTAEYALRAMVHLALNRGRTETAESIARATKVPAGYLSKVMKDLGDAGLVTGRRGPNGGFTLAKESHEVSLLDVINAVDPVQRIKTCPLGLPSHGTKLCALHQRLDDAMAQVERAFAESTIAELITVSHVTPHCSFPTLERHPLQPAVDRSADTQPRSRSAPPAGGLPKRPSARKRGRTLTKARGKQPNQQPRS